MTVYLVPNMTRPETREVCRAAAGVLHDAGAALLADEEGRTLLEGCPGITYTGPEEALTGCDVILTIGGDGTILHTARKAIRHNKPLLGVNTGHLGFLAMVEKDELFKLKSLVDGRFSVEPRAVLEVECAEGGYSSFALNDVVLFKQRAEGIIELDIFCDDILVSSFKGDGVVFATPTGSTAYSMSAGGPILDARLGGIVVTQICAHIIQTPPMVFAGSRLLHAVPSAQRKGQVLISCDGLPSVAAPDGPIYIRESASTVPLVQFTGTEQLKSIDTKLKGR